MKKLLNAIAAGVMIVALAGCSASVTGAVGSSSGSKAIVVGFSQVGAESGWRTANTISIQSSFKKAAIDLKFSDAQGKQENQIKAIRSFIQQKVDVIAFSPVVESGWDTVLQEAKAAKIPVVLTDRAVDSKDKTLYVSFLGSDFLKEGEKAGDWVKKEFPDKAVVNIAEISGTTGSAPANDRAKGLRDVLGSDSKYKIVASQTGDFTRAGGKQVMEALLKSTPNIDLVYAHNDDEGLGAIEAIEAAGKIPGKDIRILTLDATHDGLQALADGKINYVVECSPLLGDQLVNIVKDIVAKKTVPQRILTVETTFDQAQAIAALPTRKY